MSFLPESRTTRNASLAGEDLFARDRSPCRDRIGHPRRVGRPRLIGRLRFTGLAPLQMLDETPAPAREHGAARRYIRESAEQAVKYDGEIRGRTP